MFLEIECVKDALKSDFSPLNSSGFSEVAKSIRFQHKQGRGLLFFNTIELEGVRLIKISETVLKRHERHYKVNLEHCVTGR